MTNKINQSKTIRLDKRSRFLTGRIKILIIGALLASVFVSGRMILADNGKEITILNIHSHPKAGDYWTVSFETKGRADLTITPDDKQSIDDLDFVSLKCGDREMTPQILEGDIVSYPDWSCPEKAEITHLVKVAGKHTLRFQFGDQIAYVYNNPGWLPGWAKRIKLTVDGSKIDDNLTWFPITVFLNAGNGETTKVFDEIGANKYKIAIADDSEPPVEYYVEIEQWDDVNKVGVLHFGKEGTILPKGVNKDFYLYYDNTHTDNTDYVGEEGSIPGKNVWETANRMTQHMNDNPDNSHVKDSTSNANDGTKEAPNEPIEADGKIGKAQQFDSVNDLVNCGNKKSLDITGDLTLEAWVYLDGTQKEWALIVERYDWEYSMSIRSGNKLSFFARHLSPKELISNSGLPLNTWAQAVITYEKSTGKVKFYINGVSGSGDEGTMSGTIPSNDGIVYIGRDPSGGSSWAFKGIIDELRIYGRALSAAEIKASYHSTNDTLLTYGSEELANQVPDQPTNVSPADGATGVGLNPDLVGSAFSDPENDNHIDTQWQVDDDSDFSSPVWTRTAGTGETNTTVNTTNGTFANELDGKTQLNSGAPYYWRVRYKDDGSNSYSQWSSPTYFVTYLREKMLVTVSGPKECKEGESIKLVAQVKDAGGEVINDASATIDIWKPDDTALVSDASMSYVSGSDGLYSYDYTCPSSQGVYIFSVKASHGGNNGYGSDTFHVAPWISQMPSDVWSNATRTLTDYATSSIAGAVWEYTSRTLTSFGSLVSDIWNHGTRTLTSGVSIAQDIWNATIRKLTSRQIGTSTSDYIAGESTEEMPIKYNIELVRKATFDFAGLADSGSTTTLVDSELTQPDDHWNDYELWMMSGNNIGQKKVICDFDRASNTITLCSALPHPVAQGDQYVISHERKLVHAIWNWSERMLTSAANIAGDIWNYSGGRTLTAIGSLAADIWDNTFAPTRRLTDETLTGGGELATKSYIDTATTNIQALIEAGWTVVLSDFGRVSTGATYRAKLFIYNFEYQLTDPFATPTVTVYDPLRNIVVENVTMTKLSTGIYEYTYSVPSNATEGIWETVVSTEVEAGKTITNNDYWEVAGSPAQVIINQITDTTVPTITANVTITNEGTSGYEYQYEYCIVDRIDNQCGGGDDIAYAVAAKYILAGQSWTTDLTLNVSNTGTFWFKVYVYWGTEKSTAIQQFEAVEERAPAPPPSPGGGVIAPPERLPACRGADFNFDGIVDSIDFSILLHFWKTKPPFKNPCVDINGDKKVNSIDFSILLYQWGKPRS